MAFDRDSFIKVNSRPRQVKLIDVPELGGEVYIRMLSGEERERLELAALSDRDRGAATQRARMVQMTLCANEAGDLMFPAESDIKFLNSVPWTILKRITLEVEDFNGLTQDSREAAEKKSTSPQLASSSTASPGGSASPNMNLLSGTIPSI